MMATRSTRTPAPAVTGARYGDGVIYPEAEECDDANGSDADACLSN